MKRWRRRVRVFPIAVDVSWSAVDFLYHEMGRELHTNGRFVIDQPLIKLIVKLGRQLEPQVSDRHAGSSQWKDFMQR
jgi:hypothetical protein